MRATIKNYVQAERERREENGDEGFSLIELIVVVVILGILAAVAIPVFLGIQGQAAQSALDAVTANGASQAAAAFANPTAGEVEGSLTNDPTAEGFFANLTTGTDPLITLDLTGDSLDNFCVAGTDEDDREAEAGPGC